GGLDGGASVDAFVPGTDAFVTPGIDAFVVGPDAHVVGTDAHVVGTDAHVVGTDAHIVLLDAFVAIDAGHDVGPATGTVRFDYSGAIVTYVVPSGVTRLRVVAEGASGGAAGTFTGGYGAHVDSTVMVTA